MSLNCTECGKEYSYGRKISLNCCCKVRNFGAIFENRANSHIWNCNFVDHSSIEREPKTHIHLHILKLEKNHVLVYE